MTLIEFTTVCVTFVLYVSFVALLYYLDRNNKMTLIERLKEFKLVGKEAEVSYATLLDEIIQTLEAQEQKINHLEETGLVWLKAIAELNVANKELRVKIARQEKLLTEAKKLMDNLMCSIPPDGICHDVDNWNAALDEEVKK